MTKKKRKTTILETRMTEEGLEAQREVAQEAMKAWLSMKILAERVEGTSGSVVVKKQVEQVEMSWTIPSCNTSSATTIC